MAKALNPDPSELPGEIPAAGQTKSIEQLEDDAFAVILAQEKGESTQVDDPRPTAEPPPTADSEPAGENTPDDSSESADADDSGDEGAADSEKSESKSSAKATDEPKDEDKDLPPEGRNWRKRVADAQNKMHIATKELSATKKRLSELESRLAEREKALAALRPPEVDALERLKSEMTPEEQRMLKEAPEMGGITAKLLAKIEQLEAKLDGKVEATLKKREEAEAEETAESEELEWRHKVMMEYPDFFEVAESPGYIAWRDSHAETVNAIVAKYRDSGDLFNPEGAFELRRLYDSFKAKSKPKPSSTHAAPTGRVSGQNARTDSSASKKGAKSREDLESEYLDMFAAQDKGR